MAIRPIITFEDPNLRKVAKPVDKEQIGTAEFGQLLTDMRETLCDAGGIGLAAPQIDVNLRIVLFDVGSNEPRLEEHGEEGLVDTVCINPELTVFDATLAGQWEGCLSVPGYLGYVERPQGLRLQYLDEQGVSQHRDFENFLATVCQHEMDHLDGILYIDRIFDRKLLLAQEDLESAEAV